MSCQLFDRLIAIFLNGSEDEREGESGIESDWRKKICSAVTVVFDWSSPYQCPSLCLFPQA
jgi:hypothetical protein